eukprot:12428897-Karenia_brevis.AAC.1
MKCAGSLEVRLDSSTAPRENIVAAAVGTAVVQTLNIPSDHLMQSVATSASGSSRRLQDAGPQYDVSYEFVVPD